MGQSGHPPSSGRLRQAQGMACLCAGVSRVELDDAIAADASATLQSLGTTLGCGVQCGSCVPTLREALGEMPWHAATATCRPITKATDAAGSQRLIYKVELALQGDRPYPCVLPGQHVVLRAPIDGILIERTYTVVAQDLVGRRLTLAVRRKPEGVFTPWLLSTAGAIQRALELSVPGGPGLASPGLRSVVFFAAGVGVTPAVAMASALGGSSTMHLDYSVRGADDAAFLAKFEARRRERPGFGFELRETSRSGLIRFADVRAIAARHSHAKFYICGPDGYVETVHRALRRARVPRSRIHIEQFALTAVAAPARSPRARAYTAGVLLSAITPLLLLPALAALRPHGAANPGHEQLECVACHVESGASTRQALQAKAKHALGLRETGGVLGMQGVSNTSCTQCHANPDDKHAPHRFLEPRFEKARGETGAHLCVRCHREHSRARVTAPAGSYCASCHTELKVRNDRTTPSHELLVAQKRWDTCMQCHDYHGNHAWRVPQRLHDGATPEQIEHYLKDGPSPFGGTLHRARGVKSS